MPASDVDSLDECEESDEEGGEKPCACEPCAAKDTSIARLKTFLVDRDKIVLQQQQQRERRLAAAIVEEERECGRITAQLLGLAPRAALIPPAPAQLVGGGVDALLRAGAGVSYPPLARSLRKGRDEAADLARRNAAAAKRVDPALWKERARDPTAGATLRLVLKRQQVPEENAALSDRLLSPSSRLCSNPADQDTNAQRWAALAFFHHEAAQLGACVEEASLEAERLTNHAKAAGVDDEVIARRKRRRPKEEEGHKDVKEEKVPEEALLDVKKEHDEEAVKDEEETKGFADVKKELKGEEGTKEVKEEGSKEAEEGKVEEETGETELCKLLGPGAPAEAADEPSAKRAKEDAEPTADEQDGEEDGGDEGGELDGDDEAAA